MGEERIRNLKRVTGQVKFKPRRRKSGQNHHQTDLLQLSYKQDVDLDAILCCNEIQTNPVFQKIKTSQFMSTSYKLAIPSIKYLFEKYRSEMNGPGSDVMYSLFMKQSRNVFKCTFKGILIMKPNSNSECPSGQFYAYFQLFSANILTKIKCCLPTTPKLQLIFPVQPLSWSQTPLWMATGRTGSQNLYCFYLFFLIRLHITVIILSFISPCSHIKAFPARGLDHSIHLQEKNA